MTDLADAPLPDPALPLEGYARYAVYYAPAPGSALAAFGAAWFGQRIPGLCDKVLEPEGLAPLLEAPRRYGLHGTLKAPFALAPGVSPAAFDQALSAYAARRRAALAPALRLSTGLGFLSLRPSGPSPALDALAAGVVAAFARFGAPPSAETLAKRRAAPLSRRQEAYLAAYGYPYVFEEFRFHITLSGRITPATAERLIAALGAPGSPLRPTLEAERFEIDALCLFGDPGGGAPFRLLRRHPLAPSR